MRLDPQEVRRLLSETETSLYLGIPAGTLRRWRSVGMEIPYIKLGTGRNSTVRYDLRDIDRYIDERRRYPTVTQSFRRRS